jgi:hypothetical protein
MEDDTKDNFLEILVGEKLSSVTFVMDYLQADFDGNGFTFYIWPVVTVDNINYKFGDSLYRDKLCSLITRVVENLNFVDEKELVICFDNKDKLFLSLDPSNPAIIDEIAIFTAADGKWYVFK